MNKKKLILSVCTLSAAACILLVGSQGLADPASKYEKEKQSIHSVTSRTPEPNGAQVGFSQVEYKDNKSADKSKFKKLEDIKGAIPDAELASSGATRTMKQLMTYKEYFDLGIAQGFRHDIDSNRMVWVVQDKHNQPVNIFGYEVDKAIVTTVFDAETGDLLDTSVQSQDPHGLDKVQRNTGKDGKQN